MSNRSIYVSTEDWERWKDAAWRSRLSVSEMIRKAVEASEQSPSTQPKPETTPQEQ